jgi:hypothetical protein
MNHAIAIKPIASLGDIFDFFNLQNPDSEGRQFTYYTIDEQYRPEVLDVWEIIGLHQHSQEPWLLDVRFMHIDLEMFDRGAFLALQHAPSYLSVNPARVNALIAFFEEIISERHLSNSERNITHFRFMSMDDFKEIHLPGGIIPVLPKTRTYRYLPDPSRQSEEPISVFTFPEWSSQYGMNQVTMLGYDIFRQKKITNPKFQSFASFEGTHGVGIVTFNLTAFVEFIALLKQHSYENFVRTTQTE